MCRPGPAPAATFAPEPIATVFAALAWLEVPMAMPLLAATGVEAPSPKAIDDDPVAVVEWPIATLLVPSALTR